jgi:hypothetical protein
MKSIIAILILEELGIFCYSDISSSWTLVLRKPCLLVFSVFQLVITGVSVIQLDYKY